MKKSLPKFLSAAVAAGVLSLTLAACGGSTPAASSSAAPASSSSAAASSSAPVESSSAAASTEAPATSSSAAAGSASTGTVAGGNVCKQALTLFTNAATDMQKSATNPQKMLADLEKVGTDLNALAETAPNAEQKDAINMLASYYKDVAAATKTKDSVKLQETIKKATDQNGPMMKASMTLGKCSV